MLWREERLDHSKGRDFGKLGVHVGRQEAQLPSNFIHTSLDERGIFCLFLYLTGPFFSQNVHPVIFAPKKKKKANEASSSPLSFSFRIRVFHRIKKNDPLSWWTPKTRKWLSNNKIRPGFLDTTSLKNPRLPISICFDIVIKCASKRASFPPTATLNNSGQDCAQAMQPNYAA